VTDEQYLYILYFGCGAVGFGAAIFIAAFLARPNRQATQGPPLEHLGKFLRRALPTWLVMMVLLAFISVSYIECRSYAEVVADRPYLIDKAQEQAFRMAIFLAIALTTYAVILLLFLWARARAQWHTNKHQNQ